jgi:hypothetical protein
MKVLGIYRHPMFSNNAIEADRLILEQSLAQLEALSPKNFVAHTIEESEVEQLNGHSKEYDLVLTMAQSEAALQQIETNFSEEIVINSARSIRNCYRKKMSEKLSRLAIGYVPYQTISTQAIPETLPKEGAYWLKRSDFHAISDEDVCLAEGESEIRAQLKKFESRGVKEVILQSHVAGDIYKFYGVAGKFFRLIKVRDFLSSSAAPELEIVKKNAELAATTLGLGVYGGDAIFDANGKMHFIDLNDWPSFRLCREEAAKAIADFSYNRWKEAHAKPSRPATQEASLR